MHHDEQRHRRATGFGAHTRAARTAQADTHHVGPSPEYQALLRGDIEADEYVAIIKEQVHARLTSTRRKRNRWWRRRP